MYSSTMRKSRYVDSEDYDSDNDDKKYISDKFN